MSSIHPTAIVEDGARLGDEVTIGAYTVVEAAASLGDGVVLDAHVMVRGRTSIGPRTRVAPFAVIGGEPQDLSYKGEDTTVTIGADCIIREHVTIHRGTAAGHGATIVGARCFLMIGAHVAHDCTLGDNVIMTNQATLGGHVELGEYTIVGGLAAIQQRCRIGPHCFIGGVSGVARDVVPYTIALGERARLAGINVRGLSRRGFDRETIHAIYGAYRGFFFSPGPRADRIEAVVEQFGKVPAVGRFVDFLRASGNRPITLPRRHNDEFDGES